MKLNSWNDFKYIKVLSEYMDGEAELFPVRHEKDPSAVSFCAKDMLYLLEVDKELEALCNFPTVNKLIANDNVSAFIWKGYGDSGISGGLTQDAWLTFNKDYFWGMKGSSLEYGAKWRGLEIIYTGANAGYSRSPLIGTFELDKFPEHIDLNECYVDGAHTSGDGHTTDDNTLEYEWWQSWVSDTVMVDRRYDGVFNNNFDGAKVASKIWGSQSELGYNFETAVGTLAEALPFFAGEDEYKDYPSMPSVSVPAGYVPSKQQMLELFSNAAKFTTILRTDPCIYHWDSSTAIKRMSYNNVNISNEDTYDSEYSVDPSTTSNYDGIVTRTDTRGIAETGRTTSIYYGRVNGGLEFTPIAYNGKIVETRAVYEYEGITAGTMVGGEKTISESQVLGMASIIDTPDFTFHERAYTEEEIALIADILPVGTSLVFYGSYWANVDIGWFDGDIANASWDDDSKRGELILKRRCHYFRGLVRSPVMTWTGHRFTPSFSEAITQMAQTAYSKATERITSAGIPITEENVPENYTDVNIDFGFYPVIDQSRMKGLFSDALVGKTDTTTWNQGGGSSIIFVQRGQHSRFDVD